MGILNYGRPRMGLRRVSRGASNYSLQQTDRRAVVCCIELIWRLRGARC